MTSIIADIKARLEADATLMAIATGGIYATVDGRGPIRLDAAMYVALPGSGGVKALAPCIVISRSTDVPLGPRGHSQNTYLRVGAYEADGYANTGAMLARIRVLLHDKVFVVPGTNGCQYQIHHMDNPIREAQDDTVVTGKGKPGASYEASRYVVNSAWGAG